MHSSKIFVILSIITTSPSYHFNVNLLCIWGNFIQQIVRCFFDFFSSARIENQRRYLFLFTIFMLFCRSKQNNFITFIYTTQPIKFPKNNFFFTDLILFWVWYKQFWQDACIRFWKALWKILNQIHFKMS